MSLNKHRNRPCQCGSGIKFKYCCLPRHREAQARLVTPLQKQEKAKEQRYYKKVYDEVSGSVGDERREMINFHKNNRRREMINFHKNKMQYVFYIIPTIIYSYYPSGLAKYRIDIRWFVWSIVITW